jgi:hypothetical protein
MFTPAIRAIYLVSNSGYFFYYQATIAISDLLTLALLVARIFADDPNDAIALENLAISADLLD